MAGSSWRLTIVVAGLAATTALSGDRDAGADDLGQPRIRLQQVWHHTHGFAGCVDTVECERRAYDWLRCDVVGAPAAVGVAGACGPGVQGP